jgi:hypothetical protein
MALRLGLFAQAEIWSAFTRSRIAETFSTVRSGEDKDDSDYEYGLLEPEQVFKVETVINSDEAAQSSYRISTLEQ